MVQISLLMLVGLFALACLSLYKAIADFKRDVRINVNHSRTPTQSSVDNLLAVVLQGFLVLWILVIVIFVAVGW